MSRPAPGGGQSYQQPQRPGPGAGTPLSRSSAPWRSWGGEPG